MANYYLTEDTALPSLRLPAGAVHYGLRLPTISLGDRRRQGHAMALRRPFHAPPRGFFRAAATTALPFLVGAARRSVREKPK